MLINYPAGCNNAYLQLQAVTAKLQVLGSEIEEAAVEAREAKKAELKTQIDALTAELAKLRTDKESLFNVTFT